MHGMAWHAVHDETGSDGESGLMFLLKTEIRACLHVVIMEIGSDVMISSTCSLWKDEDKADHQNSWRGVPNGHPRHLLKR